MTADDFIKIETTANRAHNSLRNIATQEVVAAMRQADWILAEVRHFAVSVENIAEKVDKPERQSLIEKAERRLLSAFLPDKA